jgi:hypothetical protein
MAVIGHAVATPKTDTVSIEVPVASCIICGSEAPGRPTKVKDNKTLEFDPPDGWRRATIDDLKNSYVYFCSASGCGDKLPPPPPGVLGVRW